MTPTSTQTSTAPSTLLHHPTKPASKRRRAAAQKVDELTTLESRLLAASIRAKQFGHVRRAESYVRQAGAVRRERESWSVLANNPAPPQKLPHILAEILCLLLLILDLFVAGGNAVRRISRLLFTIAVIAGGLVVGAATTNSWRGDHVVRYTPQPWVTEIASRELNRKSSYGSMTKLVR